MARQGVEPCLPFVPNKKGNKNEVSFNDLIQLDGMMFVATVYVPGIIASANL